MIETPKSSQIPLVINTLFTIVKTQQSTKKQNMDIPLCYYCSLKRKFSINGQNQKCILHSIGNVQQISDISSDQSSSPRLIKQTLDLLYQANQNLQQYWNNLHYYSVGCAHRAKQQIIYVSQALGRLQQTLAHFPSNSIQSSHQTKLVKDIIKLEDRKVSTKSQKFTNSNFYQLSDSSSANEYIKQWVMHFYKILINREVCDSVLLMEQNLDLKIFKDSMERKFVIFASNYNKYQNKIGEVLQKLLFYMQNCNAKVSQNILKEDLLFIEQYQDNVNRTNYEQNNQLLLIQALSIERLLAQNQLQSEIY